MSDPRVALPGGFGEPYAGGERPGRLGGWILNLDLLTFSRRLLAPSQTGVAAPDAALDLHLFFPFFLIFFFFVAAPPIRLSGENKLK